MAFVTVRYMLENGHIIGHCKNCFRNDLPNQDEIMKRYGDRVWGPRMNIRLVCRRCGHVGNSVFHSGNGGGHDEDLADASRRLNGR